MKYDYTKLFDNNLAIQGHVQAKGKSGNWWNARPYWSFDIYKIRDAWNVLIGKADALYWQIDFDK